MKKSGVYKYNGRTFRYNYDECLVEYIGKVTKADKEDEELMGLLEPDEKGYYIVDEVGLMKENWKDKEMRDSYLQMWCDEMDEFLETVLI